MLINSGLTFKDSDDFQNSSNHSSQKANESLPVFGSIEGIKQNDTNLDSKKGLKDINDSSEIYNCKVINSLTSNEDSQSPQIRLSQPEEDNNEFQQIINQSRIRLRVPSYIEVGNPMLESPRFDQVMDPVIRARVQTININSPNGEQFNSHRFSNKLRIPSNTEVSNPMLDESMQKSVNDSNIFLQEPIIRNRVQTIIVNQLEDPHKNIQKQSYPQIKIRLSQPYNNTQSAAVDESIVIGNQYSRLRIPSTQSVGNPMMEESNEQPQIKLSAPLEDDKQIEEEDSMESIENNHIDTLTEPITRIRVQTINLPETKLKILNNQSINNNTSEVQQQQRNRSNIFRKQLTVPDDMFIANPLDSPRESIQLYMSTAPRVLTQSVLNDGSLHSSPQSNIITSQSKFNVIPEDEVQSVLLNSQTTFTQNIKNNDHGGASSIESENSGGLIKRFSPPHRRVTQDPNSSKRTSLGMGKSLRLSKNNTQGRMSYSPQPQIKFNINEMSEQESHYQKTISSSQMSIQQHAEELVRIIKNYLLNELSLNDNSLHKSFSFDKNLTTKDNEGMKQSNNLSQELKQEIIKRMISLIDSEIILQNSQTSPKFEPQLIGSFMAKKEFSPLKSTNLGDQENLKLKQQIEILQSKQIILEARMMEYYNNECEYKSKFQETQKNLSDMIHENQKLQQRIKIMEQENTQEFDEIQNKLLEFSDKYKELQTDYLDKSEKEKQLIQQVKDKEDEILKLQHQYLEMSKRQTDQYFSKVSENAQKNQDYQNIPPKIFQVTTNKSQQHNYLKVKQTLSQSYLRDNSSIRNEQNQSQNSVIERQIRVTPSPKRGINMFNIGQIDHANRNFSIKAKFLENQYGNTNSNTNSEIDKVLNGRSRQYYPNGMLYQGGFLKNKREGFGVLKMNHQDIYTGTWHNDLKHGTGHLKNVFVNSSEKIDYADLSSVKSWVSYQGEFKYDKFDGFGVLQFTNNEKYQGEFLEGKPNGKGTYYTSNGQSLHSIWMNGLMVRIL